MVHCYDLEKGEGREYRLVVCGSVSEKDEKFQDSMKIAEWMERTFRLSRKCEEKVYLLCCDTKLRLLGVFMVSSGTINFAPAGMKEIFSRALLIGAAAIILLHNHPSGDVFPSEDDKDITKKVKQAGELLEIRLLDHLILGEGGYYSFGDNGLI